MALYQIKISYDGTDFHGYQRQLKQRTVQGEIESALKVIGWTGESILSAGRTDTGVHADGQIAVFNFIWNHSLKDLNNAINANLPDDVSVIEISLVKEKTFSPRFDAKTRIYRYQIYCSNVKNPIRERYYWRVWPEPEFEKLEQTAEVFIGQHDFRKFGKPYLENGRTERIISTVEWIKKDNSRLEFRIEANSFLYHMVRKIVYMNILVGLGKIPIQLVVESLQGNGNLPPGIAPAKGLFLEKIEY